MKYNWRKIMKGILWCSIAIIIVGYFLWAILIPRQDAHLTTPDELREIQRELALHYSLGRAMLYIGFTGLFSSISYYIVLLVRKVIRKINKK